MLNPNATSREPGAEEFGLMLKISQLLERAENREHFVQLVLKWAEQRQSQILLRSEFQIRRAHEIAKLLPPSEAGHLPAGLISEDQLPSELREAQCPDVTPLLPLRQKALTLEECFVVLAVVHDALVDPQKRPLISETPCATDWSSHPWIRCEVQKMSSDAAVLLESHIALYGTFRPSENDLVALRHAYDRVETALKAKADSELPSRSNAGPDDLPLPPSEGTEGHEQKSLTPSESNESTESCYNAANKSENGPVPTNGFRWQREEPYFGLSPKAWLVVGLLWRRRDFSADTDSFCPTIWEEPSDVTADALGSVRRNSNNFFKKHGIPLRVETQPHPHGRGSRLVTLVRTDRSSE